MDDNGLIGKMRIFTEDKTIELPIKDFKALKEGEEFSCTILFEEGLKEEISFIMRWICSWGWTVTRGQMIGNKYYVEFDTNDYFVRPKYKVAPNFENFQANEEGIISTCTFIVTTSDSF